MKKLLIVESPAKTRTISKFLGKDFVIMSTMGHIKDLPSRELGVTTENGTIAIDYATIEKKNKVIADICKQARTCDDVFIAPDPDREGEIIAWHVEQEVAKVIKDPSRIHRITFNEITKTAILEAISHPSQVNREKVAAQQARRVLDRWVGYEVSPILWRKIKKGLSAGRVQSVAVRMVCDREEAIKSFTPEEYWSLEGVFSTEKKEKIIAALTHIGKKKADLKDKKSVDAILEELKKQSFTIDSINDKKRSKKPIPPFMTSTLQQAAFNRLNFAVKRTMSLAQNLYEGMPLQDSSTPVALITYMRTDSLRISDTALKQVRTYIPQAFGKEYLPGKAQLYSKGGAQDAHEAIRPIDVTVTPEMTRRYLPADAAKLYELIWRRFVASQMKAAEYAQRQVVIIGGKYVFKVTGSTLIFDGFLRAYADTEKDKETAVVIPKQITQNDPLALAKTNPKQHFTQPPPRYTEASLVKELEKEGIGRPSTYATILSTIQQREYVERDKKKKFIPTTLGYQVAQMLMEHLPKIMDLKFTANMERDLDKIAAGDLERDTLLMSFYDNFSKDLEKFGETKTKKPIEPTDLVCTDCKKSKLVVRHGKGGDFVGCSGFPECTFTSNFTRHEDGSIELVATEGPTLLDEKCPQCSHQLRTVNGRYGAFTACSGYPKCKFIKQEKASFNCLQCSKGDVVKKSWRGGTFWGCSAYPKCKFAIFGDIEEKSCPQCKKPFLIKVEAKEASLLMCSDKKCNYKEPYTSAQT